MKSVLKFINIFIFIMGSVLGAFAFYHGMILIGIALSITSIGCLCFVFYDYDRSM